MSVTNNNATCPHINKTHEQKDGIVIYDKGMTLQICEKCIQIIVQRFNIRERSNNEDFN